jgi:CheY-like chemotaxis protein
MTRSSASRWTGFLNLGSALGWSKNTHRLPDDLGGGIAFLRLVGYSREDLLSGSDAIVRSPGCGRALRSDLDRHVHAEDGRFCVDRTDTSEARIVHGHDHDAYFGGSARNVARCQELGVAAYLLKPIRLPELREAIARVLGANEQEHPIPLITRFSLQDARDPAGFLCVLVADGNPVNQRLVARLLEKRGHRVQVAVNGREALQALDKERFDLVLMDVQMPEMGGVEATAVIREKEKGSDCTHRLLPWRQMP